MISNGRHPISLPFFDDIPYTIQDKGTSFQLKRDFTRRDGVPYPVCGPGFQNKNFGGGFIDGACAYEEWRWYGSLVEAIMAEYIKIKAFKEAIGCGQGADYAYNLRKVSHRAYVFENLFSYARLSHYGRSFHQASIQEIKRRCTYYDRPRYFNIVAAAAPDSSNGAGSGMYTLDHMKSYAYECYAAIDALIKYFIEEKKEPLVYVALGNFGAGAFPHDKRLPYLVQLYVYQCAMEARGASEKIRFMLYPFDNDGVRGLEGARIVWNAIKNVSRDQKITLENFCLRAIEVARRQGKSLAFTAGNGT